MCVSSCISRSFAMCLLLCIYVPFAIALYTHALTNVHIRIFKWNLNLIMQYNLFSFGVCMWVVLFFICFFMCIIGCRGVCMHCCVFRNTAVIRQCELCEVFRNSMLSGNGIVVAVSVGFCCFGFRFEQPDQHPLLNVHSNIGLAKKKCVCVCSQLWICSAERRQKAKKEKRNSHTQTLNTNIP